MSKSVVAGKGNWVSRIPLPLACLAVSVAIVLAGLWPFEFFPHNNVSWLDPPSGIRFGRLGIAYGESPVFGAGRPLRPGGAVTVEMAVRPASESTRTVAHLLTLWDERERNLFTVGQWKSHLILRTDHTQDRRVRYRERGVLDALRPGVVTRLTIASDDNVTVVYVNGQAVKEIPSFPLVPGDAGIAGILVLGNSPTGHAQWEGDLLFLAIHNRALSPGDVAAGYRAGSGAAGLRGPAGGEPALVYAFDEQDDQRARNSADPRYDIVIPQHFHVIQKTFLSFASRNAVHSRWFVTDLGINVLGFIPFGWCFAAWFRGSWRWTSRGTVIGATFLGAGVSLVIELVQVHIPTRDSSLSDVLCNALGGGFGAYLATRFPSIDHIVRKTPISPPTA